VRTVSVPVPSPYSRIASMALSMMLVQTWFSSAG
jgi:hypothetical protein